MQPINRYLDHAILKPNMTTVEAQKEMELGLEYNVKSICVRPCDITLAKAVAAGSETNVSCVLAFPHGCILPESKAEEASRYVDLGVAEIDMVVNYALIRGGEFDALCKDILAVTDIARPAGVVVKTIFETSQLTLEEVEFATKAAIAANADFVKTSTGFTGEGATEEAVKVMLATADGKIKVKPSGGIRDYAKAKKFVDMGVDRLGVGSSSTPIICGGKEGFGDGY